MTSSGNGTLDLQIQVLRRLPLFRSLDEHGWAMLASIMSAEEYEAHARIMSAGEDSKDLFLIDSGVVSVFRDTPFGPQPIAELHEGALFGELSLIDGYDRSTDVEAKTKTRLRRIDGPQLAAIFSKDLPLACHFYRHFWRSLAEKIHHANEQIKRFFGNAQSPPTPNPASHSLAPVRPAWFAPPEGVSESSSTTLLALPHIQLAEAEKRAALSRLGLAQNEIDILFRVGEELVIQSGEAIFREGDFGDTLYFILKGRVRISKNIPGIGEEALAIIDAGEFFGEMALVAKNAVRSADCFAFEGDVALLAFRLHRLGALETQSEHEFPFLRTICKMMAHRLREMNEKLFGWKMMSGGF